MLLAAGTEVLLFLLVWAFNYFFSGRKENPVGEALGRAAAVPTAAQEAALGKLRDYVVDFLKGPSVPKMD